MTRKFDLTTEKGYEAYLNDGDDRRVRQKEETRTSDTPRTDAVKLPSEVLLIASEKHLGFAVKEAINSLGEHARQLERELAQSQAELQYLKYAVGECHLMISRNTSDFQIKEEWETGSLPTRLQKIMQCAESAEAKNSDLLEALKELLAVSWGSNSDKKGSEKRAEKAIAKAEGKDHE